MDSDLDDIKRSPAPRRSARVNRKSPYRLFRVEVKPETSTAPPYPRINLAIVWSCMNDVPS
jgi:hypothetical protein